MHKLTILTSLMLLLLAGCGQTAPPPTETAPFTAVSAALTRPPTATPSPSPSALPPATATATPSPTATATPSPTPTATALPARLTGNPRAAQLANLPAPQRPATCGVVDILDFPVDPPDAANISRGGGDFGVFRQRYDKYHAGEDWAGVNGGSSLGAPVYSIGHGRVMYAEPEGWNRDKGVVIIEHIFADGRSFYSFYGHLDPPSVTLSAGECIRRGQTVGDIGKPRTSPHLHFEIRTHMPYQPGPGYWPEDPTTVGWLPPSQTIWNERMAGAPGVTQLWPFRDGPLTAVGPLTTDTFLLLAGEQLVAVGPGDGRWQPLALGLESVRAALATDDLLLAADGRGGLQAFSRSQADALQFDAAWEAALGVNGVPQLWPLPGGSFVAAVGTRVWGYSALGDLLWAEDLGGRPLAAALSDEGLLLTTGGNEGALWLLDAGQRPLALPSPAGYPFVAGEQVWLVAADGVYRRAGAGGEFERVYALPPALLGESSAVALPAGGLMLLHRDAADRRLILLAADGTLRQERSLAGVVQGEGQLLRLDDTVLLATQAANGAVLATSVYVVTEETAVLRHIFSGGTRDSRYGKGWTAVAGGNYLLVNPGGGTLLALDLQTAVAP